MGAKRQKGPKGGRWDVKFHVGGVANVRGGRGARHCEGGWLVLAREGGRGSPWQRKLGHAGPRLGLAWHSFYFLFLFFVFGFWFFWFFLLFFWFFLFFYFLCFVFCFLFFVFFVFFVFLLSFCFQFFSFFCFLFVFFSVLYLLFITARMYSYCFFVINF